MCHTLPQLYFTDLCILHHVTLNCRVSQAASDGDKRAVKFWLEEKKTDVNATDWDNLTALIAASCAGTYSMLYHEVSSRYYAQKYLSRSYINVQCAWQCVGVHGNSGLLY